MLAKRVVRLVLAPGALPYALLVLVVGLIWATTGRLPLSSLEGTGRSSAVDDAASAITYRGTTGPDLTPITLEQAIGSVRRFTRDADLHLEGGLQEATSDAYYLESSGPTPGEDSFKVDARTGEVVEATFRRSLERPGSPGRVSASEAERVAERFAQDRYFGFQELTLVDRSSRASERSVLHSFKWSKIAAESGAELPVSVSIAVASGPGEVVWYLAQRDPVQIDVRPAVDRLHAIRTATSGLAARDTRWDTESPLAVRLQVLYDEQNRQQLVWSITLRARQIGPRPSLRLLVNAHTGQLMSGPS